MLGTKREEVMRDLIKLHTKKFHNLLFSSNVIKIIISKRDENTMKHIWERLEMFTIYGLDEKKSLLRSKHRLGINTIMNLTETGYKD
jgi:hypothetical protein